MSGSVHMKLISVLPQYCSQLEEVSPAVTTVTVFSLLIAFGDFIVNDYSFSIDEKYIHFTEILVHK